ncbi:MAG: GGDEF domain-containing protein [Candidatus Hydrothermia bacterium]
MKRIKRFYIVFLMPAVIAISILSFKYLEKLYDISDTAGPKDILIREIYRNTGDIVKTPFFFEAPGKHVFYFSIGNIKAHQPVIYIPFIDGNQVKVVFNGVTLGISGNPWGTNSLRWNRPEIFFIPQELIKGTNLITIEVKTENTVGIFYPIFVGEFDRIRTRFVILYILNQVVSNINVLLFVLIGLFFAVISLFTKEHPHRILIGLGIIFYGFYNIEYGFIPYLPVPYAVYKKVVISLLYLALPLYIMGFTIEFNFKGFYKKVALLFCILNFLASLVLISSPNSSVVVRHTYLKLNILLYANILWLFTMVTKKLISSLKEKNYVIYANAFLIAFYLPFAFRDIYVLISNKPSPLLNQLILSIFLFANLLYVIHDFTSVYRKLMLEKKKSEFLEQESMKDPLTGALNRRFLFKISEIVPELYSIALIDLDNFKVLNDTYGHIIGDCVLKKFVERISNLIRKDDHIVRFGGDEFILMLYKCDLIAMEFILNKISKSFKVDPIECEGKPMRISFSYGIAEMKETWNLNDMLEIADQRLYENKKRKKYFTK